MTTLLRQSPNYYHTGQILVGFMLSLIAGGPSSCRRVPHRETQERAGGPIISACVPFLPPSRLSWPCFLALGGSQVSFNLSSEFQRAIDPALKSYKQPATLRLEVFTAAAISGRSGHHLILHMSKNWGGYSKRKPLFSNLPNWPPPTSPKFTPPVENAA